jgi:hypothetical protein
MTLKLSKNKLLDRTIREQQAILPLALRNHDYQNAKLWCPITNTTKKSGNFPQRWEDWVAGLYWDSLAIDHLSGDDVIAANGETMEVKLICMKAKNFSLSEKKSLFYNNDSFAKTLRVNFEVHNGTDQQHHNKTTGVVLYSVDLCKIITGFKVSGTTINDLLRGKQTTVKRTISLSQIMKNSIPHTSKIETIGLEPYLATVYDLLLKKK